MADQETDEPKKKGGLVKIIGLVLGGLLLVGVGLGAGFFMFGGNGATPSAGGSRGEGGCACRIDGEWSGFASSDGAAEFVAADDYCPTKDHHH